MPTLRLGTRGSMLAVTQSRQVADRLQALHPGLVVELVTIRTGGDIHADKPLQDLGGKGLFTREIEQSLLASQIDLAVHSMKDLPVTEPLVDVAALVVAAVPTRVDPRDALISRHASIAELPKGARVGTTSLRRQSQLLALRPDLRIEPLRGNIDTRLRRVRAGEFDAILLAMAGLIRASLDGAADVHPIPLGDMLPAAGQGALALQCRREDADAIGLLGAINDAGAARAVAVERQVIHALNGDCRSPIAAYARREASAWRLGIAVAGPRGLTRRESAGADPMALILPLLDGLM